MKTSSKFCFLLDGEGVSKVHLSFILLMYIEWRLAILFSNRSS